LLFLPTLLLPACSRGRPTREVNSVSAPQAILRDQVATVYNKTGTVKNGEAVQVLGRDRRFVRVRTSVGAEGWIEQRYLVSQQVFEGFQKLVDQEQNSPVQATGTTRNQTNIHLEPNRNAEHLYQLDEGSKISILQRATSEKEVPGIQARPAMAAGSTANPAAPVMEDWWMVRDAQGHVGWVLARLVDIDVPLEIAQYAEGQRIVAAFVLNQVADATQKVPQYLVLLTENKDGMPFDFNQIRVFTWNTRRHRYETAYREHNLMGALPVTVSQENFDKEGTLPVFVVHVKDDSGNLRERKYKLNTPIVRRVLAPGEKPSVPGHRAVTNAGHRRGQNR
jgi:SH3-like domain-containing protein